MYKLLILIDRISNSGGTDRVASTLSSLLSNDNYDVTLFSLEAGAPYYPVDAKVKIQYARASARLAKIHEFVRFARANHPDGIMIISMGKLSVQSILALKLFGVKAKIICCDHVSIESFKTPIRKLKVFCYRLADQVVVLTDHDKHHLETHYALKNVHVVRNISPFYTEKNNTTFPALMAGKQNRVLAIGRLTYQKNFDRMLDVWKKVNKQGWTLQIVGNGEDREALLQKIKSYQLQDSTEIVSPSKQVDEYYRAAGIIIMTSRYEGLPMVLIEAKNFALPAIAFDCKTGPSEIISDDGYVIEYDNNDAFVNRLNETIADEEKRNAFAQAAWRNSDNYGPTLILEKWNQILN
ncbi:glycosyltransferase family 4 protein [Erwinia oleae]|uniref:glycosyltransferase family 4 protein n=1 Tax=Erwinia oleae TaxID=796334 RepID=UPI0005523816|nr:glycosyltransferase family 4 protein [Erwinia oleae]